MRNRISSALGKVIFLVAVCGLLPLVLGAQDRLKTMPGYEQYQKMLGKTSGAVKMGTLSVTWKEGGKAFVYTKDGKQLRFDTTTGKSEPFEKDTAATEPEPTQRRPGGRRGGGGTGVARGRQAGTAISPDG